MTPSMVCRAHPSRRHAYYLLSVNDLRDTSPRPGRGIIDAIGDPL